MGREDMVTYFCQLKRSEKCELDLTNVLLPKKDPRSHDTTTEHGNGTGFEGQPTRPEVTTSKPNETYRDTNPL